MKKTVAALCVTALAIPLAAPAFADRGGGYSGKGGFHRMGARMFEKADTNSDGAITLDEVNARMQERLSQADSDGDLSVTKSEIIAAIEQHADHRRAKRFSGTIADRLVYHLDVDDNGSVTLSEVENRVGKLFALMDFNDDGKVEKAEIRRSMPHRAGRHGRFHRISRWWHRDRDGDDDERDE